jgi:hypothetical protein
MRVLLPHRPSLRSQSPDFAKPLYVIHQKLLFAIGQNTVGNSTDGILQASVRPLDGADVAGSLDPHPNLRSDHAPDGPNDGADR